VTDLFQRSRDEEMAALWLAGKNCEEIGIALGLTEMRVTN
jgi:DNA-binding CsgD family transcriptional regulator